MLARDVEALVLERCASVARDSSLSAVDQREANVFRVAAGAMSSVFQKERDGLWQASERYFLAHPGDRLPAVEVVRQGWVQDVSRLRLMLGRALASSAK